jgi:hypothetical protein
MARKKVREYTGKRLLKVSHKAASTWAHNSNMGWG